jgi:hypothetical protein
MHRAPQSAGPPNENPRVNRGKVRGPFVLAATHGLMPRLAIASEDKDRLCLFIGNSGERSGDNPGGLDRGSHTCRQALLADDELDQLPSNQEPPTLNGRVDIDNAIVMALRQAMSADHGFPTPATQDKYVGRDPSGLQDV